MPTENAGRSKFSGLADVYSKYRPSYPAEVLQMIRENIGGMAVIADIGAGTGKFTRCLCKLENAEIICAEPNADMLEKAKLSLADEARLGKVRFMQTAAEDTQLADSSVDIVTAAQAFHWFDAAGFKAECRRILKPHGKVLLLWNTVEKDSSVAAEISRICAKWCGDYLIRKGLNTPMRKSAEVLSGFFDNFETKIFRNDLHFDKQAFIGNRLSRSYSLKEGDEHFDEYKAELAEMFERYAENGIITIPNVTEFYLGEVEEKI